MDSTDLTDLKDDLAFARKQVQRAEAELRRAEITLRVAREEVAGIEAEIEKLERVETEEAQ